MDDLWEMIVFTPCLATSLSKLIFRVASLLNLNPKERVSPKTWSQKSTWTAEIEGEPTFWRLADTLDDGQEQKIVFRGEVLFATIELDVPEWTYGKREEGLVLLEGVM